jgi:two-component system, NtrC family, sensor kinase
MSLKRSWFLIGVSAFALAVSAIVVIYRSGQSALGPSRTMIDLEIQQLQKIDADWTADVLRARTGLNLNYDAVVRPLATFDQLSSRLKLSFGDLLQETAVSTTADEVVKIFKQKERLIDTFKAQDSLFKNSLRYLPFALDELSKTARGDKKHQPLLAHAAEFNQRILYAVSTSDAESLRLASELNEAISRLVDANLANSAGYARHARTVIDQYRASSNTLASIAALPTNRSIGALANATTLVFDQRSQAAERNRFMLIALSAFLAAITGFLAWYLWRNFRDLDRAVKARTTELSNALSELKETQAQMVSNAKMSSLGTMVAGIAHEINTPVAYVKNALQLLREPIEETRELITTADGLLKAIVAEPRDSRASTAAYHRLSNAVERIGAADDMALVAETIQDGLHGVERISQIVADLKNFSRLDRAAEDLLDLNDAFESTLNIARHTLKDVSIVKQYGGVPKIRCAPSQVNQVLLNLVTNAYQATTPGWGKLTLITRHVGDFVESIVEDNGSGMSRETLDKIWDPFFTTKKVGEGTGLGLSIARKIVLSHAGDISVQSMPGVGSRFTVKWPISGPEGGLLVKDL